MNAVGIDVSKGKSTVANLRPFGEIVASSFEVTHTDSELNGLVDQLKSLSGETKVIMECTGSYYLPVTFELQDAGLTVCTVHAQLIHDFGNNSIRKVKTDKADTLKIANYVGNWRYLSLSEEVVPGSVRVVGTCGIFFHKFHGDDKISKQDSPHLCKTLFQVMDCLIKHAPTDDTIFQFLDSKRAEEIITLLLHERRSRQVFAYLLRSG